MELGKNYYSGRALDNKLVDSLICRSCRMLKEKGRVALQTTSQTQFKKKSD
jgi:hypothetical protein